MLGAITTFILLRIAGHDAALRIDAIKSGLTVGAGVGGAAALLLAFRRQWLSERVAGDTSHDATERRITDLYVKAVEQLGHEKAAVRLGGLYSLERLAQDNAEHRQTVTDVICAYLRMPFEPPDAARPAAAASGRQSGNPAGAAPQDDQRSANRQELQVRLAAQRLLARHLAIGAWEGSYIDGGLHWHGMRIDLNRAVLMDLDFSRCRLGQASFRGARFNESARFMGAQFTEDATFIGATFGAPLSELDSANFSSVNTSDGRRVSRARFLEAQFDQAARFERAEFKGDAEFDGAVFAGDVRFDRAVFQNPPSFSSARAALSHWTRNWPSGWHCQPDPDDPSTGWLNDEAAPSGAQAGGP